VEPTAEKDALDPAAPMCACGHTRASHTADGCFGCDGPPCDVTPGEMRALSLLLRRTARDHLRLKDGDYWPSGVADAQAAAVIAAGWTSVTPPGES
jgi:hypothetical protein